MVLITLLHSPHLFVHPGIHYPFSNCRVLGGAGAVLAANEPVRSSSPSHYDCEPGFCLSSTGLQGVEGSCQ